MLHLYGITCKVVPFVARVISEGRIAEEHVLEDLLTTFIMVTELYDKLPNYVNYRAVGVFASALVNKLRFDYSFPTSRMKVRFGLGEKN